MRIAALLFLCLAAPAQACMDHYQPSWGEVLLGITLPFYILAVLITWLGGLLAYGFTGGYGGRFHMAMATLSLGFVQVAGLCAVPILGFYARSGGGARYAESVASSMVLVMMFTAPFWVRRWLRNSEARVGMLIPRAGSPIIPIACFGASFFTMFAGVNPLAVFMFLPALALFAIPADRHEARTVPFVHLPKRPTPRSKLSPLALVPGHCPVCREIVRDRVEECARCHTQHHRECLEFNGRCGIFACEPGAPDPTAKKKTAS
jgi:hypothetical protein